MTILHPKMTNDMILPYGEENAVASFYKWLKDLFDHANGYPVYFDQDGDEFSNRSLTKFPHIKVQQIDTQDLTQTFIGGQANHTELLFYVYFNHSLKEKGSRRLLRRGRDQLSYALKMAGISKKGTDDLYVPPIYLWDFAQPTPVKTGTCLTVRGGIQQRFTQENEILTGELMVTLRYMEDLTAV